MQRARKPCTPGADGVEYCRAGVKVLQIFTEIKGRCGYALTLFMHRPVQRNMPLMRHAGGAASSGKEYSPTRLYVGAQGKTAFLYWMKVGIECMIKSE